MMHGQSFSRIPDFPRSDPTLTIISIKNTFTRHAWFHIDATNTRSKLNGLSRRKERWRNFWLVLYTCLISFPWRIEEKGVKWQCAREATNEIRRKFFIPTPMASVCYGSQREKIPVSDTEGPCISFARISPPVRCIHTYIHSTYTNLSRSIVTIRSFVHFYFIFWFID